MLSRKSIDRSLSIKAVDDNYAPRTSCFCLPAIELIRQPNPSTLSELTNSEAHEWCLLTRNSYQHMNYFTFVSRVTSPELGLITVASPLYPTWYPTSKIYQFQSRRCLKLPMELVYVYSCLMWCLFFFLQVRHELRLGLVGRIRVSAWTISVDCELEFLRDRRDLAENYAHSGCPCGCSRSHRAQIPSADRATGTGTGILNC